MRHPRPRPASPSSARGSLPQAPPQRTIRPPRDRTAPGRFQAPELRRHGQSSRRTGTRSSSGTSPPSDPPTRSGRRDAQLNHVVIAATHPNEPTIANYMWSTTQRLVYGLHHRWHGMFPGCHPPRQSPTGPWQPSFVGCGRNATCPVKRSPTTRVSRPARWHASSWASQARRGRRCVRSQTRSM
jgi:hypothetical protein